MRKAAARHSDYREDQRGFFDELITRDWNSYLDQRWATARTFEVRAIMSRVGVARDVLDVGCGCGFHDVALAEHPGVERVVGIDPSARSIEVADREYAHPKVARRVADVLELPAPGRFDLVVSFQVIEHLRRQEEFLRACAGQARPGGIVAVATPNRRSLVNRLRTVAGRPPEFVDPQHFAELDAAELKAMGSLAGLESFAVLGRGLTIPLPKTGRTLLTHGVALRAGAIAPGLADVICVLFRRT